MLHRRNANGLALLSSVGALLGACSLLNAPEDLKSVAVSSGGEGGSGAGGLGGSAGKQSNAGTSGDGTSGEMSGSAGEAGSGPIGQLCTDSAADCGGGAPICDDSAHSCRACARDPECAALPGLAYCADSGRCIECKSAHDCSADSPVCGPGGTCRACAKNDECVSGVCDVGTGVCSASATAVYVLAGTGSSSASCGDLAQPCLQVASAVSKLSLVRPNLVFIASSLTLNSGIAVLPALKGLNVIGNHVVMKPYDGASSFIVNGGSVTFDGIDLRGSMGSVQPALDCSHAVVAIKNSHFEGNSVAVNASECDLSVSHSFFEANAAPLKNGFVALSTACTDPACAHPLTIESSRFEGNGKALYTSVGSTVIRNSLFLRNGDAGNYGDYNRVLEFRGTTAKLSYNTLVENFNKCSYVGLLACANGVCDGVGNISWNNFPMQTCQDQVFYSFATLSHNLTEVLFPGARNKVGNPLFVAAATGNYTPGKGSPAIDSGNPADTPASDYNNKPRPVGAAPDVGAIEVQ